MLQLVTLDPAHFHAALVHKEMLPGVNPLLRVYAPPGLDIDMHLQRVRNFNTREERPTNWQILATISPDYMDRFLRERPGGIVILAGRNHTKIDVILTCIEVGYHVLADKPLVISVNKLTKLDSALALASENGQIVDDVMTERFEITSILQQALLRDGEVFGQIVDGSAHQPAVRMESVHALRKFVAGRPLQRALAFFDTSQQGESLADVGTHLVDLVQWIVFPDTAMDPTDVQIESASRWPTPISIKDFYEITGGNRVPEFLVQDSGGQILYPCNNRVVYRLRGVQVCLTTRWEVECPGGDTHFASFVGSRSTIEVRQISPNPELFVHSTLSEVFAALEFSVRKLALRFPGIKVIREAPCQARIDIPPCYRVGHEAHFREVALQFLSNVRDPTQVPRWHFPGLRTKYWTTTHGVLRAHE